MMPATRSWDELKSTARSLEGNLQGFIAEFVKVSKSGSLPLEEFYDEENPPQESETERKLKTEIENSLELLTEVIDEMSIHVQASSSKIWEALLQRYREVCFDYKSEYHRTLAAIEQKREASQLFGSRINHGLANDSDMDSLLREGRKVDSSKSLANTIIEQATATKNALANQRSRIFSSRDKVHTLSSSFAGINTMITHIRQKKIRNNIIIAMVIAICICFSLWWTVLSKF